MKKKDHRFRLIKKIPESIGGESYLARDLFHADENARFLIRFSSGEFPSKDSPFFFPIDHSVFSPILEMGFDEPRQKNFVLYDVGQCVPFIEKDSEGIDLEVTLLGQMILVFALLEERKVPPFPVFLNDFWLRHQQVNFCLGLCDSQPGNLIQSWSDSLVLFIRDALEFLPSIKQDRALNRFFTERLLAERTRGVTLTPREVLLHFSQLSKSVAFELPLAGEFFPYINPVFLGREDLVVRANFQLESENARVIEISGKAGVGKTRFLQEMLKQKLTVSNFYFSNLFCRDHWLIAIARQVAVCYSEDDFFWEKFNFNSFAENPSHSLIKAIFAISRAFKKLSEKESVFVFIDDFNVQTDEALFSILFHWLAGENVYFIVSSQTKMAVKSEQVLLEPLNADVLKQAFSVDEKVSVAVLSDVAEQAKGSPRAFATILSQMVSSGYLVKKKNQYVAARAKPRKDQTKNPGTSLNPSNLLTPVPPPLDFSFLGSEVEIADRAIEDIIHATQPADLETVLINSLEKSACPILAIRIRGMLGKRCLFSGRMNEAIGNLQEALRLTEPLGLLNVSFELELMLFECQRLIWHFSQAEIHLNKAQSYANQLKGVIWQNQCQLFTRTLHLNVGLCQEAEETLEGDESLPIFSSNDLGAFFFHYNRVSLSRLQNLTPDETSLTALESAFEPLRQKGFLVYALLAETLVMACRPKKATTKEMNPEIDLLRAIPSAFLDNLLAQEHAGNLTDRLARVQQAQQKMLLSLAFETLESANRVQKDPRYSWIFTAEESATQDVEALRFWVDALQRENKIKKSLFETVTQWAVQANSAREAIDGATEFLKNLCENAGVNIVISSRAQVWAPVFLKGSMLVPILVLSKGDELGGALKTLGFVEFQAKTPTPLIESVVFLMAQALGSFLEQQVSFERMKIGADQISTRVFHTQATFSRLEQGTVGQHNYEEIIGGRAPSMMSLLTMLDKIVPTTATVLIEGESGTGKELVARALHQKGPLSEKPMVTLNCGALSQTVLESQLFGHVKGAFTGATADQVGLLEMGDGGTVFLDEIGELPLDAQVKLLRALQDGEIRPLGSDRVKKVRFRLICATNRSLEKMVREGSFRKDFYYRINVIELHMPSLRDRREDIPFLVEHFLRCIAEKSKKPKKSFTAKAMKAFVDFSWPGNVRQLENVIETLCALRTRRKIDVDQLPGEFFHPEEKSSGEILPFEEARNEFLRNYLGELLEAAGGKVPAAAEMAGVERESFYRLMRRHGVV